MVRGMTLLEVADELGRAGMPMSSAAYRRIENGERKLGLVEAMMIASVLRCEVDDFVPRGDKLASLPVVNFNNWLKMQAGQHHLIGDLAREACADRRLLGVGTTPRHLLDLGYDSRIVDLAAESWVGIEQPADAPPW